MSTRILHAHNAESSQSLVTWGIRTKKGALFNTQTFRINHNVTWSEVLPLTLALGNCNSASLKLSGSNLCTMYAWITLICYYFNDLFCVYSNEQLHWQGWKQTFWEVINYNTHRFITAKFINRNSVFMLLSQEFIKITIVYRNSMAMFMWLYLPILRRYK